MSLKNTWSHTQPRTRKKTFSPKWDSDTIVEIQEQLAQGVAFVDIQFWLVKTYGISIASAALWIGIAKRVKADLEAGYTMTEALSRDRERRNAMRRKTTT